MVQRGLVVEESDDPHTLAWFKITNSEDEADASSEVNLKLWQQAQKELSWFPGSSREMDGRVYRHRGDNLSWRGRGVKDDLTVGGSTRGCPCLSGIDGLNSTVAKAKRLWLEC